MHLAPQSAAYIPTSDSSTRHEYGVTKTRKTTSTGGGRAWSEDEELYLLQTRLQKMPYKHIAAHLKKTELACRLHYHQLSHGNNRRKRTASVSSGSSAAQSPVMPTSIPSPAREPSPRTITPPASAGSFMPPSPAPIQLPSIMSHPGSSPRLPQILPKPLAMTLPPPVPSPTRGYPTPMAEPTPTHAMRSATFPSMSTTHQPTTPPLRLDCSPLPPIQATHGHSPVDVRRLQAVYAAHCGTFWNAVANEYGGNVAPSVLEHAWRTGSCCNQHGATTPISPLSSPDNLERDGYGKVQHDKTRISAILGIDADPRSPREREMVRRMEQGRTGISA